MSREAAEAIERIIPKYGGSVRTELQEAAKIARGLELKSNEEDWQTISILIPVMLDGEQVGHAGLTVTLDSAMLLLRAQFYPPEQGAKETPYCIRETRVNPSDRNGYYAVNSDGHNVTIADVWGGHRQVIDFDEWQQWEVWPNA